MKKRNLFLFYIVVILFFTGCVSLKDVSVYKNEEISEYKYALINSTESLTSNVGTTINGVYVSEGKTVNPRDIISGYLMKRGFIIITEISDDIKDKTLIVNYGESGRRNILFGYTTEVTLQFISAGTKNLVCSSTAEGIGDTEADDIKEAITRALEAVFEE